MWSRPILLQLAAFILILFPSTARADYLDTIGVTLFRATTTNLDGSGIRVAQPEAYDPYTPPGTNTWEVDPSSVGQPTNLFTYYSSGGTTNTFPNDIGFLSGHADSVADYFYGISGNLATNVAHVDNYDANYFVQVNSNAITMQNTVTLPATNIDDLVVNQSFTFGVVSTNLQELVDSAYDNYAAQYDTLFISAVNNGGPVCPPGTSYNCIGVGDYDGSSSVGPTPDNGRCKPDIVALGDETSWATPMVAGSAAVLAQAALRGDGGANTNAAADIRTLKALLLNGAVKPSDWTNSTSSPLDARYGAGILNLFNSFRQLIGGQSGYNASASVQQGSPHPPVPSSASIPAMSAWDFNSISSTRGGLFTSAMDGINHYFFNVTNDVDVTATLVWERQANQTGINNLALFLYNCANSNLITCCTSIVDNVQHIFVPQLPPGRYDLQVWKAGGNFVSPSESYALAWAFTATPLAVSLDGSAVNLSWPAYPTGFVLESATNLNSPVWSTNNLPLPVFSNGWETVSLGATNPAEYFLLAPP
ncbi:MAG: S8 family serine peptidase [Limisphaerales bacterium]